MLRVSVKCAILTRLRYISAESGNPSRDRLDLTVDASQTPFETNTATGSKPRRFVATSLGCLALALLLVRMMFMFWTINKVERRDDGRLSPCPASPNCVCSQDHDAVHQIEPLRFVGAPRDAWQRLATVLTQLPRTRIVTNDSTYLHVEFTTPLLRFVDDVEFLLDETAAVIHVRSASRVGHSDLGANRTRIEIIRGLIES